MQALLGFAPLGSLLVGLALCLQAGPAASQEAKASRPRSVRVSVVGDSVAVNLGDGLRRFGRSRRGLMVQVLAEKGCGMVRGDRDDPALERGCDRWQRRWSQHLKKFDPDIVLVATAGWDVVDRRLSPDGERLPFTDPRVEAFVASEYEAVAQLLSSRGARVVFLTSPCLVSSTGHRQGAFDVARTQRLNDAVLRPLAQRHPERVSVLDLYARVCPDDVAATTIEGMQNVRPDGVHFSPEASVWLAAWLWPELDAIAQRDRAR